MTTYFFDTSALLKRYVVETGTDWVRSVTSLSGNDTILIAQITPVELVSAVSRQKREGVIAERAAKVIRLLVNRHAVREYEIVQFHDAVSHRAQILLENYPLRAYDSVQLASAIEANTALVGTGLQGLIFVSADDRLLKVASQESLTTHKPE